MSRRARSSAAAAGLLIAIAFGLLIERRTAAKRLPMTDVRVYFRAAWAAWHDPSQLYTITDDHGWHYQYPPLLAILTGPLADPPPQAIGLPPTPPKGATTAPTSKKAKHQKNADLPGGVPPTARFAIATGVWYLLSLAAALGGTALLAKTCALSPLLTGRGFVRGAERGTTPVEDSSLCPALFQRREGVRCLLPFAAFLPPLGNALMRGQVEPFLLLLIGLALWLAAARRSTWAGISLAGAICIKVIPACLLLYPIWRRDARWLVGSAAGLLVGVAIVPAIAFGPARTIDLYRQYGNAVLLPGVGGKSDDASRNAELTGDNATDNQSLVSCLANAYHVVHGDAKLSTNNKADLIDLPTPAFLRAGTFVVGIAMVLATLWAWGWPAIHEREGGAAAVLFMGLLIVPMLLISPVCHSHYLCLLVPLGMGAYAVATRRGRPIVFALLLLNLLAGVIFLAVPLSKVERNLGLVTYPSIALWAAGVAVLRHRPEPAT